jgi:hypothetical protein
MSHLTSETLARLVDEAPTPVEQSHLDACAQCTAELDAFRTQTSALAALPAIVPPDDAWASIFTRAEADRVTPIRRSWVGPGVVRAAAAVLIFAIGAVTGQRLAAKSDASSESSSGAADGGATRTSAGPNSSTAIGSTTVATAITPELALARLRVAEMMYTNALLDYAALTSPQPPRDAVARLATLETIVLTTRTALERAPADPLINSYHLAALAERETLLGQLRRTPETGQWY